MKLTSVSQKQGTVGKAMHVLDEISAFGRPVRFGEILAKSTYPKATLYRLVQTLLGQDLLNYDRHNQTYAPGIRLLRLAHAAWRQSSLAPVAKPMLDALSAKLQKTIHLAQLDNGQVLYVDKRDAQHPIDMFSQAGQVAPAYCTGIGKVMLAFLPANEQDDVLAKQSFYQFTKNSITSPALLKTELIAIRQNGAAFDDEEHEASIICVAVPILSASGRVLGGLSVTSTTQNSSLAKLKRFVPEMQQTASDIALTYESWRFPQH